ncbi:MAG: hypothetical protein HMLKMBBP_03982 [Planctomycetes bacterium]|nr:hypothetical protein [Planctomycetota bacterium]
MQQGGVSGMRSDGLVSRKRGRALRGGAAAALAAFAAVAIVGGPTPEAGAQGAPLTTTEVEEIVADCLFMASRVATRPDLTVAVVDPEGNSLGVFHAAGVPADAAERENRAATALSKAATGAYFSSDDQTFSTRTAAFIIQDHFPPGVRFFPGGPLYGVQFSSFATSDVNPIAFGAPGSTPAAALLGGATSADYPVPAAAEMRVRGDLGGLALYRGRKRVGGLGVDDGRHDGRLTIPNRVLSPDGCRDEYRISFSNLERARDLERIAVAGAGGFLAPGRIRATAITVDGITLPYAKPTRLPRSRAGALTPADGAFDPAFPLRDASTILSRFSDTVLAPPPGAGPDARDYVGQMPAAFPVQAGSDGILTAADVSRILWQGARRASITRGAIRRPIGLEMQCWISVVDTNGEVLGVFRYREDATLFSYDVSVQKARTAAFFSDDKVAWSCRAVGLFSQAFYPAGQQDEERAPLFQLQDGITVGLLTGGIPPAGFPLRNGITVFPGGVPLYKDGVLAGAVGVSGDGVDQDDIVADDAATGFKAPLAIRCDASTGPELRNSLRRTLNRLESLVPAGPAGVPATLGEVGLCFFHERLRVCRNALERTEFDVKPSWVKFPRHPGPVTIR